MLIGGTVPSPTPFGTLPTGETVGLYSLGNAHGFSVAVIPYGATVVSVQAPDSRGQPADVVLGLPTLAGYLAPHPYLGAVAGRVAGRIRGARFTLDGRTYRLAANDKSNHLHGGAEGFSRKLWTVEVFSEASLRLSYHSPDDEEGYPGAVRTAVTYSVTPDNALVMETEATADRPTPFSLTQHSYFNLAGRGHILDHELQIFSDAFAPAGDDLGLLGRRERVAQNDFRQPRRLGEAIPHLFREHGDLYFLPRSDSRSLRTAAILRDPRSGRVLTVQTDEDCLQFYTGAFLDGTLCGENGRRIDKHAGLCLECEGYPDALNSPALGNITLRPDEMFRRTTIYAFSTI
jgi:aldose 1-epimerase